MCDTCDNRAINCPFCGGDKDDTCPECGGYGHVFFDDEGNKVTRAVYLSDKVEYGDIQICPVCNDN